MTVFDFDIKDIVFPEAIMDVIIYREDRGVRDRGPQDFFDTVFKYSQRFFPVCTFGLE